MEPVPNRAPKNLFRSRQIADAQMLAQAKRAGYNPGYVSKAQRANGNKSMNDIALGNRALENAGDISEWALQQRLARQTPFNPAKGYNIKAEPVPFDKKARRKSGE